MPTYRRCPRSFFERHHVDVARDLLDCLLVWDDVEGIVVETEAYAAEDDPACHVATRPSAREFFGQNTPGTVYAYVSYGTHWLLNVLAADGIVLLRAIEPTEGIDLMRDRRGRDRMTELCSGPGKLGQALGLCSEDHGTSLLTSERHLQQPLRRDPSLRILTDVRVGLSTALDRQWRFLIAGNPHVSVPAGKALSRARTRHDGDSMQL